MGTDGWRAGWAMRHEAMAGGAVDRNGSKAGTVENLWINGENRIGGLETRKMGGVVMVEGARNRIFSTSESGLAGRHEIGGLEQRAGQASDNCKTDTLNSVAGWWVRGGSATIRCSNFPVSAKGFPMSYQLHRLIPVMALMVAIATAPVRAAVSDEDIDRAVKKLQTYLLANQQKGSWEHMYENPHAGKSGVSAMVIYALVASGVSVQHPQIQEAIKVLRGIQGDHVYEVGLRCHAWGQLPDEYKNEMQKDSRLLRATGSKGVFSYKTTESPAAMSGNATPPHDHSNTQYGLLGLWESSKRGVTVDAAFWQSVVKHFVEAQAPDGGWNYRLGDERPSYFNMTAAGVTALLVAEQELYRASPKRNTTVDKAMNKGLQWLDKNYDASSWGLYGVYSVERVGLGTGIKFFNKKDWFAVHAEQIVKNQKGDGNVGPVYDSCFALLFLTRGRVPVWCTKLQVDGFGWNNRPNDIYFLSKDLGEYVEGEMNFQTVNIDTEDAGWFNAPIAWLSGDEKIELTDEQKAKIKRFIDQGGMLIVNTEAGSGGAGIFKAQMKKMFEEMYPHKFTRLDNNHYLFKVHHKIDNGSALNITSLSNGARDLVIMPERDWGMLFQTSKTDDQQFKAAINLFVLATERGQLDNRLDAHVLRKQAGKTVSGEVKVARAKYEGNWAPEPAVWNVMDVHLFNKNGKTVKTEDVALDQLSTSTAPFVHLAGTDPIKLTDAQLSSIKTYVENGGTIFVETIGGKRLFAGKMEEQLTSLFKTAAAPLGRGSAVISGEGIAGGWNNRSVSYRRYSIIRLDARHEPRLAAFVINNRPAVIISHEDLSLGALGVRLEGLLGYSRESSVSLLGNMVLAANQKVGAGAPAAPAAPAAPKPAETPAAAATPAAKADAK